MKKENGNPKVVFSALVGSENYGLNDKTSDRDYKVFVLPTLENIYLGEKCGTSFNGEKCDIDVYDIRNLESLIFKSNPNFIEVLFSKDLYVNEEISNNMKNIVDQILEMKYKLSRMNLPYLYQSSMGTFASRMKSLDKVTGNAEQPVKTYGNNKKQAMQAYRVLDLLDRFYKNGFKDFRSAIYYSDENEREFIKSIKSGGLTKEEFMNLIGKKEEYTRNILQPMYMNNTVDNETLDKLKTLLRELLNIHLKEELKGES